MAIEQFFLDALVCPADKKQLVYLPAAPGLACTACPRRFPIIDGVPVLLTNEAISGSVASITGQNGQGLDTDSGNRFPPAASTREGERRWHDELFRARSARDPRLPAAIRDRYLNPPRRPLFERELMFRLSGDVRGKKVLSFGCGDDSSTVLLALKGAEVSAFDLSIEAIRLQERMAQANGVRDRLHTTVCAAEELPFASKHFDLIFGSEILHHVPDHLATLAPEVCRVLKDDGIAIFSEPVIRSKLLKRILDLLPGHQEISPGERQLDEHDLALFREGFVIEETPFTFLSRLDRFILSGPLEFAPLWQRGLVYSLHAIDYLVLRMPLLNRLAGVVVMKLAPRVARHAEYSRELTAAI
jgi:2-polyprenyl-3-methyl-5-hydroxy-6-metoxy-1,4-benzoquinol methylase/uncharacterized protein YbaR (Trm112 family)